MATTAAAAATSQDVTLPFIPELFNPTYLDVLVPLRGDDAVSTKNEPKASHPMIDALKATSHRAFTENGSPAFNSTLSATLDAFQSLRPHCAGSEVTRLLEQAWKEDPGLTLRIIWNVRSIHDGKGDKELFYQ